MAADLVQRRPTRRSATRVSSYNIKSLESSTRGDDSDDFELPSERESEVDSEVEEEIQQEDEDEDEYVDNRKRNKQNKGTNKRLQASNWSKRTSDPEDNELYTYLSDPSASIEDLVTNWVDSYEENELEEEAVTGLINLILRSCGCVHLFQPHDLTTLESAKDTIDELAITFKKQKTHEYPFISTNKDVKFFRKNVLAFFQQLTSLLHNRGLLYLSPEDQEETESFASPLVYLIFTWLLTLTTSEIRPLRYVSTVVLLEVQSELCQIYKGIAYKMEKLQRQLLSARSTKRPVKEKIDSIQELLNDQDHKKSTLMEYFNDLIEASFSRRYRDIDHTIRYECINALGDWIIIAPSVFLSSNYLRYLGWLLSDPHNTVRTASAKSLVKLYKLVDKESEYFSTDLLAFTEKFEDQFISMAFTDKDVSVRSNLGNVLAECTKLGLLSEDKQSEVLAKMLTSLTVKRGKNNAGNNKLLTEYSKFIHLVHSLKVNDIFTSQQSLIKSLQESTELSVELAVKYKVLIEIYTTAYSKINFDSENVGEFYPISASFEDIYNMPYYNQSWEFLLDYLQFDFSLLEADNADTVGLIKWLDISLHESLYCLWNLVQGALSAVSKGKNQEASLVDDKESLPSKAFGKLSPLLPLAARSDDTMAVFIKIFVTFVKQYENFATTIISSGTQDVLLHMNHEFMNLFKTCKPESVTDAIMTTFKEYFVALPDFAIDVTPIINTAMADLQVQFSALLTSDLSTIEKVEDSLPLLWKFNVIGNDIAPVGSSDLSLSPDDQFRVEIFDSLEFADMDPKMVLDSIDSIIETYSAYFDYVVLINSAKLEILMNSDDPLNHNILSIFQLAILNSVLSCFKDLDSVIRSLNDTIGSSSIDLSIQNTKTLIKKINELQALIAMKVVDLVVCFKVFYEKYKHSNNFYSFDQFFNQNSILSEVLPYSFQNKLLNIFLIKEANHATNLKIDLDRNANENVAYNDNDHASTLKLEITFYDSDNNSEDLETQSVKERAPKKESVESSDKQQKVWQSEEDLCVYTIKLVSLIRLGMVNEFIPDRIKLNSDNLGSVFSKLINYEHTSAELNSYKEPQTPVRS